MSRLRTVLTLLSLSVRTRAAGAMTLAVCLLLSAVQTAARADSPRSEEYTLKLVFMYNFLKFVDWPEEKLGDANDPLIIGYIGDDVFKNSAESIEQKTLDGRHILVERFKGIAELEKAREKKPSQPHPQLEAIRKSHLLFFCPSEAQHVKDILRSVAGHHIVTVADTAGFLEAGGIINLLVEEDRIRFEVNLTAARKAQLQLRSKLLRLAKRTYEPPEE